MTRRLRVMMLNANCSRVLVDVLAEVLEPLQARLRGALGGQHDGLALALVRVEGGVDRRLLVQAGGERQGVLHGELGARADGEVRGVGGVAEQHDVLVPPVLVAHRGEVDPPGVVGHHLVAVEHVGEQLPDPRDRLLVGLARGELPGGEARRSRPRRQTSSFISTMNVLPVGVERVAVDLHHAVRRLADVELEGVEDLVGAQPHVLAGAHGPGSAGTSRRTGSRTAELSPSAATTRSWVADERRRRRAPRSGSARPRRVRRTAPAGSPAAACGSSPRSRGRRW